MPARADKTKRECEEAVTERAARRKHLLENKIEGRHPRVTHEISSMA